MDRECSYLVLEVCYNKMKIYTLLSMHRQHSKVEKRDRELIKCIRGSREGSLYANFINRLLFLFAGPANSFWWSPICHCDTHRHNGTICLPVSVYTEWLCQCVYVVQLIITIATIEKTWECLLCNFFPFFFGRPIFLFISLLVSLPHVDGILILSDRCSSGILFYYYFFLFRYKRGLGAHPIIFFTEKRIEKKIFS